MAYSTMTDYEAHNEVHGHPAHDLPLYVREAMVAAGDPIPAPRMTRQLALHTPPPVGYCAHCGVKVPEDQHLAAHAVAGFEDAHSVQTGDVLRMLVTHCDEHWLGDHCSRDNVTPGSGWLQSARPGVAGLVGAGGWCEPIQRAQMVSMALIPGAPWLARWSYRALTRGGKWALTAAGLYALVTGINTSRGMATAMMAGPLANTLVPGDAISGHGFNAGLLRVLDGTAPSGANAADKAEVGTLLINWSMNATAFGAPSAATPPVTTAGSSANVNASATGTATYARLVMNGDGAALSTTDRRFQMTVGAGSGELSFNTLSISSGGACSVTSFTITGGA